MPTLSPALSSPLYMVFNKPPENHPSYSDNIEPPSSLSSPLRRRKRLVFASVALVALVCLLFLFSLFWHSETHRLPIQPVSSISHNQTVFSTAPTGVLGPPTPKFRDNLLPHKKYLTSWPAAGWTNDVMAFGNLIYLALITDRIPLMPKFTPSHVRNAKDLPFSEVFDVPRLSSAIGIPVVDWEDVKNESSTEIEDLGCWSIWQSQQYYEDAPRLSWFPLSFGLDISHTKSPPWVKATPGDQNDKTSRFWDLAKLAFPEARDDYLNSGVAINRIPSPIHNTTLDPEDHLLCMDYLFYVNINNGGEYEADYSPQWRYVLNHAHFTERLENIASLYLRNAFNLTVDAAIPPFIAIHMRRGDFGDHCNSVPKEECFPTLAVVNRRVQEVKDELAIKFPGIGVEHVIMTSDESDEAWWKEVTDFGWYAIDHSRTAEIYGQWYPVIIDAVIQSMGHGFIGTYFSTFSTLARRRVESWQNGVTRVVKWGSIDADNH